MIQRINSKGFVASLLAGATDMAVYFKVPFPTENVFLQLVALRTPVVYIELVYSYNLFLFATPYIGYPILLSGLYVFGLIVRRKIQVQNLPPYPDPAKRDDLFLLFGEIHNRRRSTPSENHQWLTLPERALFTAQQSLVRSEQV